jgi:hypothetical protein
MSSLFERCSGHGGNEIRVVGSDPLKLIQRDLCRVLYLDQYPITSSKKLLRLTGLDGDAPDERTLADRFLGTNQGFCERIRTLRTWIFIEDDINRLLELNKRGKATLTEGQEELTQTLAMIVAKQISREGFICPLAESMLTEFSQSRPDLVPKDVRAWLSVRQCNEFIQSQFPKGERGGIIEIYIPEDDASKQR